MVAFEKQYADIPDCSRLEYTYSDYNSASVLSNLPKSAQNDGKDTERRKWELIGPGGSDLEWPGMLDWLAKFPCEKMVRAHISLIPRNFSLPIHRDGFGIEGERRKYFDYFNTTLRFHIVLKTTPDAFILSNGKFYHMGKDELWMLNNFQPHSAVNRSQTIDRYHVIFDVEPNARTLKLVKKSNGNLGISNQSWLDELDWRQSKAKARPANTGQLLRGPDFFIIGDFTCGGRELLNVLSQHSNVSKAGHAKGYLSPLENKDEFLSLFPVKSLNELSGHLLPNMFFRAKKIGEMYKKFPKAKFVVVLPDPAHRASEKISENQLNLEQVLQKKTDPVLIRGQYSQFLRRWHNQYQAENFHFVSLEELRAKPDKCLQAIQTFLGLSSEALAVNRLHFPDRVDHADSRLTEYYQSWNKRLEKVSGRELPW